MIRLCLSGAALVAALGTAGCAGVTLRGGLQQLEGLQIEGGVDEILDRGVRFTLYSVPTYIPGELP